MFGCSPFQLAEQRVVMFNEALDLYKQKKYDEVRGYFILCCCRLVLPFSLIMSFIVTSHYLWCMEIQRRVTIPFKARLFHEQLQLLSACHDEHINPQHLHKIPLSLTIRLACACCLNSSYCIAPGLGDFRERGGSGAKGLHRR